MAKLKEHFSKDLHHAYLIEGDKSSIIIEATEALENLGVKTIGNPDFLKIEIDTFKIDDARELNLLRSDKSFESESKKIFIIAVNSILPEAQNTLLKLFEEPIPNTHFFLIVPDASSLLKTFLSRFYVIKNDKGDTNDALEFVKMLPVTRLAFLKDFLTESDEESALEESVRTKALRFVNSIESILHAKGIQDVALFHHIFKVRQFLRMPGASAKWLLESLALLAPVLK